MATETRARSDVLEVTRVRHPLTLRRATVVRVVPITPHLIRITLRGAELRGFESASFDDHVKVFFPAPGTSIPMLPLMGPDGRVRAEGAAPFVGRDFTPRHFDPITGELDLEFFLHEAGPATTWAVHAAVGQCLGIGGPRGSMIIPSRFDWHLLIGDDTALPAIARRLEELPRGVRVIVIAEVAGSYAQVDLKSHADMQVTWCHRDGPQPRSMAGALDDLPPLPPGEGYAWAAGEAAGVRRIRSQLLSRGMDKSRIRAAAYWKRGAQALHEVMDD